MLTRGGAVRWFRVDAAPGRASRPARATAVDPGGAARPRRWRPPRRAALAAAPRSARCRRWPSCTPRPGRCRCWPRPCWRWRRGRARRRRRAALLGWAFGTGLARRRHLVAVHQPAPLRRPAGAAGGGGGAAAGGGAVAVPGRWPWPAYARWRRGRAGPDALLFAALWLLAELARGVLFTGFPWVASGYAQVDAPLAVLAPWVGVYGIGAAGGGARRRWRRAAAARPRAAGRRRCWRAGLAPAAGAASSRRPAGDTVAWRCCRPTWRRTRSSPPSACPRRWPGWRSALTGAEADLVRRAGDGGAAAARAAGGRRARLLGRAATRTSPRPGRAALVGVPLGDFERGYTNSVVGLSAGAAYRYDKHHLVPFGEFIPTGLSLVHRADEHPARRLRARAGAARRPSPSRGQRIAPNICYEDLFGEELALRFADAGAPRRRSWPTSATSAGSATRSRCRST